MKSDLRLAIAALLPRLRRFGIALTGSRFEADELVQDACERALSHLPQLRDHARLDAWMYAIMRNLWISGRVRPGQGHHDIDEIDLVGDDGEAVVETRSTLSRVRRALAQIPSSQRTVLVLVCVDGLSYRETADVLAIPIGTVMSRLFRGRQALHEILSHRPQADTGPVIPMPASRARHEAKGDRHE